MSHEVAETQQGTIVKILTFLLTSIALIFLLNKLADHTITGAAIVSPQYAFFAIPIIVIFAAFWWWLFRIPRR